MRFLLILCDDETTQLKPGDPGFDERRAAYAAFDAMLRKRGLRRDGGKLHSTATARTVRVRNGKTLSTDGPFAETKEQVGGYYVVECKDMNEALELAAAIPTAKHGAVEVRPIEFWTED